MPETPDPAVVTRVFGDEAETAERYADILGSRGVEWGLVGPREVDRIWERHIYNSVAPASLIGAGLTVADVGSGAGLPGIPIALARPDLTVTLVEPLLRRSEFLELTVSELELTNVHVVRARAEELDEEFDIVTARAVSPLQRLLGWTEPMRGRHGVLLALKGAKAAAEISEAQRVLTRKALTAEILTVRADAQTEPATVVRVAPTG